MGSKKGWRTSVCRVGCLITWRLLVWSPAPPSWVWRWSEQEHRSGWPRRRCVVDKSPKWEITMRGRNMKCKFTVCVFLCLHSSERGPNQRGRPTSLCHGRRSGVGSSPAGERSWIPGGSAVTPHPHLLPPVQINTSTVTVCQHRQHLILDFFSSFKLGQACSSRWQLVVKLVYSIYVFTERMFKIWTQKWIELNYLFFSNK